MQTEHEEKQVTNSQMFVSHSYKAENLCKQSSGFISQDLYDLINEDEVALFWLAYNEAMKDHPALLVDASFGASEVSESMELAWQVTSQRTVDELLFESLKQSKWKDFTYLLYITAMESREARFESIRNIFKTDQQVPVQMQLNLVA